MRRARRRLRPPVLVSAHRCGAGGDRALENTRIAFDRALDLPVDFVEFDVQRCGDGTLVLFHDDRIWAGGRWRPLAELSFAEFAERAPHFLRYDEVLADLAGVSRAHVDLKFVSDDGSHEVEAAALAVEVLGEGQLIVTTLEDSSVRAVRDWADTAGHELLVGLSLGRSVRGLSLRRKVVVRVSEMLPSLRYTRSRANLVVAKHTIARLGVARFARRRGLPLLVWTVDTEDSLRYWMRPGRAWLVTSNDPELALTTRDGYAWRLVRESRRARRVARVARRARDTGSTGGPGPGTGLAAGRARRTGRRRPG